MPVSESERCALQERSRRALKTVKEASRTTTAPVNVWTPPPKTKQQPEEDVEKIRPWCLLNKKQVVDRIGVSFPTIWKWMRAGKFPRARTVGDLKSVWLESEIAAWMSALPLRRLKDDSEA
jgi:predicted DNA-binding transcriptional regulator AlpA